ncbi:MAG: adenylate/guanylate cyclase domain-containing protein [Dehalococcoidia bacterium]
MDVPPVQYAITTDGVSIAWAEVGQGPALLYCPPTPFSHVLDFFAVFEAYCAALARSFRLIVFDARGTGMSERDVADVSAATLLMDAEAVIDAAKLDRFAVFGDTGHLALSMALQLAAVLPERVTHLVLESPYQNIGELADTPYGRTGLALAEADWAVYTQTVIRVLSGWDPNDSTWLDPLAQAVAGWVDPSVGLRYIRVRDATDVGDLLAGVRQPTLVLRNEPNAVPARYCQRIAARIPGAQFRQFSDPTYEQTAELIRAFVGLAAPPAPAAALAATGGLRTVLFTDLVGHTEMMQRLGDAKGRAVLREHERITREALVAHGGSEVKAMGDGFMASFGSVTRAMDCAIALQRAFATHSGSMPEPLHVRVGLNAGEPIEEDGDLFGSTVILASRIAAQAGAGEILIPEPLRHLLSGKSYIYADRGEFAPKGFDDAVRLYEVRWRA